jgi:hypothetical protein
VAARATAAGVSCAFRDCQDPSCDVCRIGRMPVRVAATPKLQDGIREDAKAVPQARPRVVKVSKKRHRVGPHR